MPPRYTANNPSHYNGSWGSGRMTFPSFSNAACKGMDVDLFYSDAWLVQEELRDVCDSCPVLEKCRTHARTHEEFGFWAGETEKERQEWRREQRREQRREEHQKELAEAKRIRDRAWKAKKKLEREQERVIILDRTSTVSSGQRMG